jgi:hypothetical protein
VGRYSFDVKLFHLLLSAGLSRRTIRCTDPVLRELIAERHRRGHDDGSDVDEASSGVAGERVDGGGVQRRARLLGGNVALVVEPAAS